MASSSQPHKSGHHHIYVSLPEWAQPEPEIFIEDAHEVPVALSSCGLGSGDVVLVSTFAHQRVAEAITRCGAEPIFIDVSLETWHVSAEVVDMVARWCHSVGATPKALVMVDVYGMRPDVDELRDVCSKYDMALIEDHRVCGRHAQKERLPAVVARRREIHTRYRRRLAGTPGLRFMPVSHPGKWNPWQTCVVFEEFDMRDQVLAGLAAAGIEGSSLWRPLHTVPAYADATAIVDGTAEYLFEHGLCLPNSSTLTDGDVDVVVDHLRIALQ